jgi:hypothetical protein
MTPILILCSPSNSDNHPLIKCISNASTAPVSGGGNSLGTHDNDLMRQISLPLKYEDIYNMDLYLNARKRK